MGKKIVYCAPVEYMSGSLAVRPELQYNDEGGRGYDVPEGQKAAAVNYTPTIIACMRHRTRTRYFAIRTRSTVNMSANYRLSVAVMGGAGALFAAIMRDKSSQIYAACVAACPHGVTLRKFVVPVIAAGLRAKAANISVGAANIVNPWVSSDTPNVPVPPALLDKFRDKLSNS